MMPRLSACVTSFSKVCHVQLQCKMQNSVSNVINLHFALAYFVMASPHSMHTRISCAHVCRGRNLSDWRIRTHVCCSVGTSRVSIFESNAITRSILSSIETVPFKWIFCHEVTSFHYRINVYFNSRLLTH